LILDASGSMNEISKPGTSRIEAARLAGRQIIPGAAKSRRMGLMTFGPGPLDQCSNFSLKVPVQRLAAKLILNEFDSTLIDGGTPLTSAIEAAADVLDHHQQKGVVVVVTDGEETCGRDPCAAARQLRETSSKLTIHVIGIDTGSTHKSACLAEETGGEFIPTKTLEELTEALRTTLDCPHLALDTASAPSRH
jgi:Ca-activated chloride channel family protein